MKKNIALLSAILFFFSCTSDTSKEAVSPSPLDETHQWYHDAKFGMFIHWGLYSIQGKPEWFRYNDSIPDDEYHSLVSQFNPTDFDADAWVKVARSTGMKWITITAKHHDGFAIYNSPADEFDINATPFGQGGRDPLKELAAACKKHGIKLGYYYSHYQDWDHPGGGAARITYAEKAQLPFREYMDEKALPQVKELLTRYGDVAVIWFDTPMHLSESEADEFRDLVRQTSPGSLIGGRLDEATGDFWSMPDNRVPENPFGEPWETCMTSSHAWGWRTPPRETRPAREMIQHLCTIVSRGGNFLLNTGPDPTGKLNPNDVAEYKIVGEWLKTNGEAIYGTSMNPYFNSPYLCTTKENRLYFHLFEWPDSLFEIQRLQNHVKKAWLLADPGQKPLEFSKQGGIVKVFLPKNIPDSINSILVVETEGLPEVQNLYPSEDNHGIINIPAKEISIVNNSFSFFDKDEGLVRMKDTKRAWLNGWFEVKTPGKYQIVISQLYADTSNNHSYWIRVNGQRYTVPVENSTASDAFIDQEAGIIEFADSGVFNFTIRPTNWYLQTDNTLVKIKDIRFIPGERKLK